MTPRYSPQVSVQESPSKEESQVSKQKRLIEESLESLDKRLSSIVTRCEPILHPPFPASQNKSSEDESQLCEMAMWMHNINLHLIGLIDGMLDVIDRIEL